MEEDFVNIAMLKVYEFLRTREILFDADHRWWKSFGSATFLLSSRLRCLLRYFLLSGGIKGIIRIDVRRPHLSICVTTNIILAICSFLLLAVLDIHWGQVVLIWLLKVNKTRLLLVPSEYIRALHRL